MGRYNVGSRIILGRYRKTRERVMGPRWGIFSEFLDKFNHINLILICLCILPIFMGQRAQSLMLAGIMFLSVLTGMLMLDLSTDQDESEMGRP